VEITEAFQLTQISGVVPNNSSNKSPEHSSMIGGKIASGTKKCNGHATNASMLMPLFDEVPAIRHEGNISFIPMQERRAAPGKKSSKRHCF
jgi:hypothetical protein